MPEDRARGDFLKVEEVHFAAEFAVIALGSFLEHVEVLFQTILVLESNAIDPLEHGPVAVAAPIGPCHRH